MFLLVSWLDRADRHLAMEIARSSVAIAERCDIASHDLLGTLNQMRADTIRGPWGRPARTN